MPNEIITNDNEIKEYLSDNKFSLASLNAQSLRKNISSLRQIMKNLQTDFIAISETYKPTISYCSIQNYHPIVIKTRPQKRGGGVGLYIKDNYQYQINLEISQLELKACEVVAVNITNPKMTIISIYKPPNSNINTFLDELKKILNKTTQKTILCGDININLNNNNNITQRYLDTLQEYRLEQKVVSPTRITPTTATLIDHICTDLIDLNAIVTHHSISDHQIVLAKWGKKTITSPKESPSKQKEKLHYAKSLENIKKTNWNDNENTKDVNEQTNLFITKLKNCLVYETAKPKRKTPIEPWYNQNLIIEKQKVDKQRKKFLKIRNNEDSKKLAYDTYNELKKEYKRNLLQSKKDYFRKKLLNSGKDSKKIWATINECLHRKQSSKPIKSVICENKDLTNSNEIAQAFNNHFNNQILSILPNAEGDFRVFQSETIKQVNTLELQQITIEDTKHIISELKSKNSSGHDKIPSKLIKMASNYIAQPITTIINTSIETSIFPDLLKTAKITPTHKKNDNQITNFRPISQLPGLSKIIEKEVKYQLEENQTNIENKNQFGFKKRHNTLHPILILRHYLEQNKQKGEKSIVIFLDFKSAFDTIDVPNILIPKLIHYGATEKTAKWFDSFYSDRYAYTIWNDEKSQTIKNHKLGVVQGSNLGAILFNCFTDDMQFASNFKTLQFADDTILIISNKNLKTLFEQANKELKKIQKYIAANRLILNKTKTNYMLFQPNNRNNKQETGQHLYYENTILERVNETKYLGIIIDNKLNFNKHYEYIKEKVVKGINALIVARYHLNYKSKLLIYNSLIKSYLDYNTIIWLDKLNSKQTTTLEKLQKRAIRLIFNTRKTTHTNKLFLLSNITKIKFLYTTEAIKFCYKYQNDLMPEAINEIIRYQPHNWHTRNKNSIPLNPKNKKGSAIYNIIKCWNSANKEVKTTEKYQNLKTILKKVYSENTPCQQRNCFNCSTDTNRNYEAYMNA